MKFFALSLLFVSSQAFAGAWLLPRGEGQIILQERHQNREPDNLNEVSLYEDYGLFDHIGIGVSFDFTFADVANTTGETGARSAFVKGEVFRTDRTVTSVQLSAGDSKRIGETGSPISPATYEIRLQEGLSFDNSFVDAQVARRSFGSGGLDPEFIVDLTYGYNLPSGRQLYFQNFNTWAKTFRSHEFEILYVTPFGLGEKHRVMLGASVPWGTEGLPTSVITVLGYRYDF